MLFNRFIIETGKIHYQEVVDSNNLSPTLQEHGRRLLIQLRRDVNAWIPLKAGELSVSLGLPENPDDPEVIRAFREQVKAPGFFRFVEPHSHTPISFNLALSEYCTPEEARTSIELFIRLSAVNLMGQAKQTPLDLADALIDSRPFVASTLFRLPTGKAVESIVANFPPVFAIAVFEEQERLSQVASGSSPKAIPTERREVMKFTAVVTPDVLSDESPIYVSHCPELDIASQGDTKEEALANLKEAIEGIIEAGGKAQIERLLQQETCLVTSIEVGVPEEARSQGVGVA